MLYIEEDMTKQEDIGIYSIQIILDDGKDVNEY